MVDAGGAGIRHGLISVATSQMTSDNFEFNSVCTLLGPANVLLSQMMAWIIVTIFMSVVAWISGALSPKIPFRFMIWIKVTTYIFAGDEKEAPVPLGLMISTKVTTTVLRGAVNHKGRLA